MDNVDRLTIKWEDYPVNKCTNSQKVKFTVITLAALTLLVVGILAQQQVEGLDRSIDSTGQWTLMVTGGLIFLIHTVGAYYYHSPITLTVARMFSDKDFKNVCELIRREKVDLIIVHKMHSENYQDLMTALDPNEEMFSAHYWERQHMEDLIFPLYFSNNQSFPDDDWSSSGYMRSIQNNKDKTRIRMIYETQPVFQWFSGNLYASPEYDICLYTSMNVDHHYYSQLAEMTKEQANGWVCTPAPDAHPGEICAVKAGPNLRAVEMITGKVYSVGKDKTESPKDCFFTKFSFKQNSWFITDLIYG